MPSNISWPQSCFYNAWRSIRCGFVSEALQLCAHIKYSHQLPCRLKRSMPLDLSGLWGKQTTVWIPELLLFGVKRGEKTKLVALCFGYFWHSQFYDRIWWWLVEKHFIVITIKRAFHKNLSQFYFLWALTSSDSRKDFVVLLFIVLQALFLQLCCWFALMCNITHFW